MSDNREILNVLEAYRKQDSAEHSELRGLVMEIKEDLRGNPDRDIEGVIPKVKRHDKILKPVAWLGEHKKFALVLLFIAFHLLAYCSFKGLDKILTLIP